MLVSTSVSHVTCSQVRRESQIPQKPEGSLLLPLQIENSGNSEGTMPGATTSPDLHLLILDSPQYITISDAGQYFTRMRYYFHYKCIHFIDYFDDSMSDCAVMYAGNIPLCYN